MRGMIVSLGLSWLTAYLDALYMHLNFVKRNTRILGQSETYLIDEIAGNRLDVGTVFYDHIKLYMDTRIGGIDHNAAAQARCRQDLCNAIDGTRGGHSHDPVAFHGGITDDIGQNVVRDMQIAWNR